MNWMKTEESTSAPIKEDEKTKAESIERFGMTLAEQDGVALSCITVIGQIEGHYLAGENQKTTKYEHILPLLAAIEENPSVDGLLVIINTVGGDVEAGLALAELIASMKKPSVSVVLGGGHSIGVPLAVAAKRSFIVPSATMTVHPVRTNGLVVGVPQSFEYLRRMQSRITAFVARNSRISEDKLTELMMRTDELATDVGSVIDGKEAAAMGLIDEVGGLDVALDALHAMIRKKKDA